MALRFSGRSMVMMATPSSTSYRMLLIGVPLVCGSNLPHHRVDHGGPLYRRGGRDRRGQVSGGILLVWRVVQYSRRGAGVPASDWSDERLMVCVSWSSGATATSG